MHQSLTPILDGTEHRIMVRLDRIEAAQLATATHSMLTSMADKCRSVGNSTSQHFFAPQLQANLSLTCWQYSSGCLCSCHRSRERKRTPTVLDRFIGILFVGYVGLPHLNEQCDTTLCTPSCFQRSDPGIRVVYLFPAWLLARAMIVLMKYSLASGPEFIIRVPRIVSFQASIFQYAGEGDLCGIKRLFKYGLSSPFDVDPRGTSTLMVSQAAYFCMTSQSLMMCELNFWILEKCHVRV